MMDPIDSRSGRLAGGYDVGNTDGPPDHPETGRTAGIALPFLCGIFLFAFYLGQLPDCGRPVHFDGFELAGQAFIGALAFGLALAVGGVLRARHAPAVVREAQSRWLWPADESWAGRTIVAADPVVDRWLGLTVAGLVLSAMFMASIPVQIRAAREAGDRYEAPSPGLVLVVGLLGCFVPGLRESSRRRRYGSTTIRFDGAAPRVGGKLVATVRIERGLGPASRIDCTLRCQRRQFTLQKYSDNPDWVRTDTLIWATRFGIDPWDVRASGHTIEIPIEVDISPLSRPTDWSNWQDQVAWDLVLDSGRGLLDYRARIELPVHPPRGAPG